MTAGLVERRVACRDGNALAEDRIEGTVRVADR
jgi:hypothetical protein